MTTSSARRKIAVGVDLSPDSELAVAHAVACARRDGREVVLVLAELTPALPDGYLARSPDLEATYLARAREAAAANVRGVSALRDRFAGRGVEISQIIVDGHPDQALPSVAAEIGADLIAVGTHGRTGLARLFLGSVAELVARLADRSVLIARGDAPDEGYRRIVIGTDFTPLAERAVDQAVAMAAPRARIDLVHCWQLNPWVVSPELSPVLDPKLKTDVLAELAKTGEAVAATIRKRGEFDVHLELLERPAAHGLDRYAKDIAADLIAVGSHGRRGVRRFLLGSVAEVTLRHAPCTVLVAR